MAPAHQRVLSRTFFERLDSMRVFWLRINNYERRHQRMVPIARTSPGDEFFLLFDIRATIAIRDDSILERIGSENQNHKRARG